LGAVFVCAGINTLGGNGGGAASLGALHSKKSRHTNSTCVCVYVNYGNWGSAKRLGNFTAINEIIQ